MQRDLQHDRPISIHAPREGGDATAVPGEVVRRYFNPRPPRGGRLKDSADQVMAHAFQSTPPREGGDAGYLPQQRIHMAISIHAPPRGGRQITNKTTDQMVNFNPRPPARGATRLPIKTQRKA